MIYDVIPFFNELTMLELRMEILDPYVDFFVINESLYSFTGNPKPLFFDENRAKFKKFKSKIIHQVCVENKPEWNQWERELVQKGSLVSPLVRDLNNKDIIILSDTDEIPDLIQIDFDEVYDTDKLFICDQLFYYYYFNTLAITGDKPFPWQGSRMSTWKLLKRNSTDTFRNPNSGFSLHSPNQIVHVPNAGWHFTFLNNPELVKYKIQSYSHQEFNNPFVINNIQENMKNLKDVFYRNQFEIKPIEMTLKTHPLYLMDHLDKYKEYIYKP